MRGFAIRFYWKSFDQTEKEALKRDVFPKEILKRWRNPVAYIENEKIMSAV